ncbi:MAG TPA: phosphoribosylglycinamide formyltransferase [Candidatus Binatia bacterium]|nr:phosphoribosylglycinamide formyltransferase [Candidatus Binatia bacterium]
MKNLGLGLLASHGGTNVQAHIDAWEAGRTPARPSIVISNNSQSLALERARRHGVPTAHLSSATHPDPDALDRAIRDALVAHGVRLVALCGYMKKLGPATLAHFGGRILNVHPGPLPRFGGQGMYGRHVHEAVVAAGVRETEVCIFVVEAEYDTGPVIARRAVAVAPSDTADSLAERVLPVEHELYVDTVRRIATGELALPAPAP